MPTNEFIRGHTRVILYVHQISTPPDLKSKSAGSALEFPTEAGTNQIAGGLDFRDRNESGYTPSALAASQYDFDLKI